MLSEGDSHVKGVVRLPERVREGAEHGGHTILDETRRRCSSSSWRTITAEMNTQ